MQMDENERVARESSLKIRKGLPLYRLSFTEQPTAKSMVSLAKNGPKIPKTGPGDPKGSQNRKKLRPRYPGCFSATFSGTTFFSVGPPPAGIGDLRVFWPPGHLEKFWGQKWPKNSKNGPW